VVHIPDKGHVTTRYDGWYANRRWATLLQQIAEVDPLTASGADSGPAAWPLSAD